jgi:transcriptional regulator with XRE-family HTH domain
MTLGEYVKERRLNAGMSQTDLADELGLSITTIVNIERDKTAGLKSLNALAEYFKVDVKMLRALYENNE